MYVKITYTDGYVSFAPIKENIALAPVDRMLPEILCAEIFNDKGKRVAIRKRKHQKKYILEYLKNK